MDKRLRFNSKQLKKLLELWKGCPKDIFEQLSPGISQFEALSSDPNRYEIVRYPHQFFEIVCSGCMCVLERGDALKDETIGGLIASWNALQISTALIDNRAMMMAFQPALNSAMSGLESMLQDFKDARKEYRVGEEGILKVEIQEILNEGTLHTLQMLRVDMDVGELVRNLQGFDHRLSMILEKLHSLKEE